MIPFTTIAAFAFVALGIVLTPGPTMTYVVSRTLSQGRAAGLISLGGVGLGLASYMLLAAFGIAGVLFAFPVAYDTLRIAGALYLGYLAWQALKPGGKTPFQAGGLTEGSPRKLFAMGVLTSLLNPQVAILYVALLPQFINPERGNATAQTIVLGTTQICIAVCGNAVFVMGASGLAHLFRTRPTWMRVQRYFVGSVLASFAVRMAIESH